MQANTTSDSGNVVLPCQHRNRDARATVTLDGDVIVQRESNGKTVAQVHKSNLLRVGTSPDYVVLVLYKGLPIVLNRRWSDAEARQWEERFRTGVDHVSLIEDGAVTLWAQPSLTCQSLCCSPAGMIACTKRSACVLRWAELECVMLQRTTMTNTFDACLLHSDGHLCVDRLPSFLLHALKAMCSSRCTIVDKGADVVDRVPSSRPSCGWQAWFE